MARNDKERERKAICNDKFIVRYAIVMWSHSYTMVSKRLVSNYKYLFPQKQYLVIILPTMKSNINHLYP